MVEDGRLPKVGQQFQPSLEWHLHSPELLPEGPRLCMAVALALYWAYVGDRAGFCQLKILVWGGLILKNGLPTSLDGQLWS